MIFAVGQRVRGLPNRTDWRGMGTIMRIVADQLHIYEDEQDNGSAVEVVMNPDQVTPLVGRRGDILVRRPAWHTEHLRIQRLISGYKRQDQDTPRR